jgi:hypothetical protein
MKVYILVRKTFKWQKKIKASSSNPSKSSSAMSLFVPLHSSPNHRHCSFSRYLLSPFCWRRHLPPSRATVDMDITPSVVLLLLWQPPKHECRHQMAADPIAAFTSVAFLLQPSISTITTSSASSASFWHLFSYILLMHSSCSCPMCRILTDFLVLLA